MGKGSGVFCAMLFSCLLLTGCAENPTEDIVVNKNEGKLEQAIQRENKKDSYLFKGPLWKIFPG